MGLAAALKRGCRIAGLFRCRAGSQPISIGPPWRAGRYGVLDYVADAVAFVKGLNQSAVIYGHSLGAMVAAAVASELPDSVEALVLEDPPFETMGSRIREGWVHSYFCALQRFAGSNRPVGELSRELSTIQFGPPGSEESMRLGDLRDAISLRFSARALKSLDPEVLVPIIEGRWLEGYNRNRILQSIRCPTLILQADGRVGGMLTDADADEVERQISDCTRVRMINTGHLIHWGEPEKTVGLVVGFLESLDGWNRRIKQAIGDEVRSQ